MSEKLIDISEASEIIGTSVVTARHLLGKPEKIERTKYNLPRYFYSESAVSKAKESRNISRGKFIECRRCHCQFPRDQISSGKCRQCNADICVLKFCGLLRRPCDDADPALIACLRKAIDYAEAHYEK